VCRLGEDTKGLRHLASRLLVCRGLVKWKWITFVYLCDFLLRDGVIYGALSSQYDAAAICHRTERPD